MGHPLPSTGSSLRFMLGLHLRQPLKIIPNWTVRSSSLPNKLTCFPGVEMACVIWLTFRNPDSSLPLWSVPDVPNLRGATPSVLRQLSSAALRKLLSIEVRLLASSSCGYLLALTFNFVLVSWSCYNK